MMHVHKRQHNYKVDSVIPAAPARSGIIQGTRTHRAAFQAQFGMTYMASWIYSYMGQMQH